jgi:hypothetical protein
MWFIKKDTSSAKEKMISSQKGIRLKDLNISSHGVLSTSFKVILSTDTAKEQIKALEHINIQKKNVA